ncbi:hypothetical protein ACFLSJ_07015, partial [Verrucomicrobiota bacterium]
MDWQDILKVVLPIVVTHGVVLVAIVFIIKRLLLSDTMNAVARIRQAEAELRKREDGIREEVEQKEREIAKRKQESEEELELDREKAEKEAAQLKEQSLDEAKREARQILDQARKNEQKVIQQAEHDSRVRAVEFAGQLFRLVFSEDITEAINRQFTDELLDAFGEMDAANITVDTDEAEVTVCAPMAEEQRSRL